MDTIGKGIIAGFIATLALSLLVDPLLFLTSAAWTPASALGWQLQFFVGPILWGAVFAFFHGHMPGPSWRRGVVFAVGVWLVVVVIAIPTIGAGRFGGSPSLATLAATLIIHILYGALLGAIYGELITRDRSSTPANDERLRPLAR